MKKIITTLLLTILFIGANAQYSNDSIKAIQKPIQSVSQGQPKKAGKTLLVMSGAAFMIGSFVAYNSAATTTQSKRERPPL